MCVVISSLHTDEGVNGDSTVVCMSVVISFPNTDEGVNGDSTVGLEETSPEDLEDFN